MADNIYTTSKGSVLPLMKLKGKDYMIVQQRLVWLNDDVYSFTTDLEVLKLTDDSATVKMTLCIFNELGQVTKRVQDVKSEERGHFMDFLEKAVTGALGRCLAQAGFGTSFALQDLDEGTRLADSPVTDPQKKSQTKRVVEPDDDL